MAQFAGRLQSFLVFAALPVVAATPALTAWLARPALWHRLMRHPEEITWWGASPALAFAAAWLVVVVGYRATARIERSGPLPISRNGDASVYFFILAGALGAVSFGLLTTMYSRHSRDLGDEFPGLEAATFGLGSLVILAVMVLWVVLAVVHPWTRYLFLRKNPTVVDADFNLGGSHSVRIVYRPTVGHGGPMRVDLGGVPEFEMSPGQAVGFLVGGHTLTIKLRNRVASARSAMSVHLNLDTTEGTLVVVSDGLWPRVRTFRTPELQAFDVSQEPFVSMWTGIGASGPPIYGNASVRVGHREGRFAGPAAAPWPQMAGATLALVAAGLAGYTILGPALEYYLDDSHVLVFIGQFCMALALAFLSIRFHRIKSRLGIKPTRMTADFAFALLAGALFGAGHWLLAAVGLVGVLGIYASRYWRDTRYADPPRRAEELAYWRRLPEGVGEWVGPGARSKARRLGHVRVARATTGSDIVVEHSAGAQTTLGHEPFGLRGAPGPMRLTVVHGEHRLDVEAEVQAGMLTHIEVGLLPFGLQFSSFHARPYARVHQPVLGRLKKHAGVR